MQVNEVISLIANITWLMMFVAAVIFIVIEGVFERDIRKENEDLKAELDEKDEKLRYLSDVKDYWVGEADAFYKKSNEAKAETERLRRENERLKTELEESGAAKEAEGEQVEK